MDFNMKRFSAGFMIILIAALNTGAVELKKAPDFSARTVARRQVILSELVKKGPVLIDFWALWCIPCLKELPHLQTIYQKYKDQGLSVLAINQDDPSSESKVRPFLRGKRYTFDVIIDTNKELWRKFKIVSLPTLFLIDTEGRIYTSHTGYRPGDENALEQEIQTLLNMTSKQGESGDEK